MPVRPLVPLQVERVWGVTSLPPEFEQPKRGSGPIGEIWHQSEPEDPLLVKHLFTSARLSIQVHPDDAMAQAAGQRRGKDECWLVIDAEPDARIGLGLVRPVDRAEFEKAVETGQIEQMVDWKPVRVGDFFYAPAGTVHAIGAGLSIIEIQQNSDTTYRLYDYGRPRELHLDKGLNAASLTPWISEHIPKRLSPRRVQLACSTKFSVERWTLDTCLTANFADSEALLIPVDQGFQIDGEWAKPGQVLRATGEVQLMAGASLEVLVTGTSLAGASLSAG